MKMKRYLYLILLVVFCFSSCDDEKDCLIEKNNIREHFEGLILQSENQAQIESLRKQMNDKIKNLDC